MAPNPRGIPTPRSAKVRRYNELTIVPRRNPLLRPAGYAGGAGGGNLIAFPPDIPVLKKGIPQTYNKSSLYDIIYRPKPLGGANRVKAQPVISRIVSRPDLYDEKNWHNLLGKFRFNLTGTFTGGGSLYQRELFLTAKDLFLVGWIKCRSTFAIGHLQGDVYATSFMRRWMTLKLSSNARVNSIDFYDENFGMAELEFTRLLAIKDYRNENRRHKHTIEKINRFQSQRMYQDSLSRALEHQAFIKEWKLSH